MGRPPCCDMIGVKKGPWTPEEDLMLVSYIQEHSPGNWRAVPTNTGLMRCSKSCRLRWTNYLRPGIKRGSFTEQEEKLIIRLQALLGNRWAAIASYLQERTDNDIKNYWNTHLKKKLTKQLRNGNQDHVLDTDKTSTKNKSMSKGQWERRLQTDINMARKTLHEALSYDHNRSSNSNDVEKTYNTSCFSSSTANSKIMYAFSTENVSQLLQDWMKNLTKETSTPTSSAAATNLESTRHSNNRVNSTSSEGSATRADNINGNYTGVSTEGLCSLLNFESPLMPELSEICSMSQAESSAAASEVGPIRHITNLESWLFDESVDLAIEGENILNIPIDTANLF